MVRVSCRSTSSGRYVSIGSQHTGGVCAHVRVEGTWAGGCGWMDHSNKLAGFVCVFEARGRRCSSEQDGVGEGSGRFNQEGKKFSGTTTTHMGAGGGEKKMFKRAIDSFMRVARKQV